jgi:uncharacterized protein (DUF2236 family)
MPGTPEEFWPYFDTMIQEELESTVVVRELLDPHRPVPPPPGSGALVRRLWPLLRRPMGTLHVFVTVGLLPPAARDRLGVAWTPRDERRLRRLGAVIRTLVPLLPECLRYLPTARAARARRREPRSGGRSGR